MRTWFPKYVLVAVAVLNGWNAQADDRNPFELDPVVVSASRSSSDPDQTADAMTVYTEEDLSHLPAHDLGEALAYMPGVSIQRSGPFGQATAVSMRGADSRQVLVMVDGVPFNTQLSGQANLSRIPLEQVERIEVIRGGASSVWGSSLGGVINVITRATGKGPKPRAKVTSSYGDFASTKNSLDVSGGAGPFGMTATGSFLHSDGDRAQSRTRETKTFTKLSYDFTESTRLNASFGYSGAQLRYGPTDTRRIYDQPYISRYGKLDLSTGEEEHHWDLSYKYNDQDVTADTYNSTSGALVSSTVSRDFYQGASLVGRHEIDTDQVLVTGWDFDRNEIKSTAYLKKAEAVNKQAPFANYSWTIRDWVLQPGMRYDYNSRFGSQLSPGLGAVYHIPSWDGALIRTRAARVFNAPPLLWLFNDDPAQLVAPNPDLKAERAYLYELGGQIKPFDPLTLSVDGYYSDVRDGIGVVFTNGMFQSRNFKKLRRAGGQATADYKITGRWSMYTSGEFNDVRNTQTKTMVRDAAIARHAFKWGSHYRTLNGFGINLEGYYSRSAAAPEQANDRKPIFDLRLTKDFKSEPSHTDVEIFLNLHNLTNSSYFTNPIYPDPGRSVDGGLSLEF